MARLVALAAAAATAAAALAAPAHARPGDVDATFGVGGQSVLVPRADLGTVSRGLAQQADGKLLVSGAAALYRLEAGGGLDREFGEQGVVATQPIGTASDPIVLADGRIVLVGIYTDPGPGPAQTQAAAMRLTPEGRLDPTFGDGGLVKVPGGGSPARLTGGFGQADGRIVLLGQGEPPGTAAGWGATAARLMSDGALDESFGEHGWTRLEVPNSGGLVYDGAQRADGKLLVAGEFDRRDTQEPDYHWTLFRLTADGSKDPAFDGDGVAQPSFYGQGGTFGGFATQPDGKLLLAGSAPQNGAYGWGVSRATAEGQPDPSFGDEGRVWMQPPGTDPKNPLIGGADRLAVQTDGRIVVSGNRSGALNGTQLISGWALARLTSAGRLDPDFGDGGWSGTAMAFGNRLWPSGLVRTPEGKVVMSGDAMDCGSGAIALVRFHAEDSEAGRTDAGPAMRTCDPVVEAEPDGDLPIEVQCPLTEDVCRGTGEVEIPSADVEVGRKSFKLRGAREATLRIRSSKRARRYIARPRGVRAEIVYRTKDGDGHRRVTRRKLRLKQAG